jgi:hypothetical protein
MIYNNALDWQNATQKRVVLFGMSGLGKTHASNMLRASGDWFHYSIDYRIGTRYMGEFIEDSFKREAMGNAFLRDLLMSDSIKIKSNITFDNLAPLSTYLGKPGRVQDGGLAIEEYRRRQQQHHRAEVEALLDTPYFIDRARDIYGYEHFVCDSGGSICEVVDPADPNDPVLSCLAECALMVWIEGSDAHTDELIKRFDRAPKPMCYQASFLDTKWDCYLAEKQVTDQEVDPNDFVRWAYAQAMAHRQPIYRSMSKWGVKVTADEVAAATTPKQFDAMIVNALERTA